MPADDHALRVEDVTVVFGGRPALDGLTLHVGRATITTLLGCNGAGKTTLIRCCTGLIPPSRGTITVLGLAPGSPEAAARIGVMPQSAGAWAGIRTVELLRYLAGLYATPHSVPDLMDLLGINEFAGTPYRRLSGGQQQRANLAAALIGRPELVFLDEPTAGMDPHVRRRTWDVVAELRKSGVSVVLTTHSMEEASRLSDYVWIIHRGRTKTGGTIGELTQRRSLEETFLAETGAMV